MRSGICAIIGAVLAALFFCTGVSANPVSPGGITEFSVDPDWIEIHFQHWSSSMFKQPFFVDGKEVTNYLEYNPAKLGEYVVFDNANTSGFDLKPEGGFIYFPELGDTLRYGPGKKYPAPPAGESVVLFEHWDSIMKRYVFSIDPTPTRGSVNDSPTPHFGNGSVFLNEVFPGGNSIPAFIELFNRGDTAVDIGGYSLISGTRYRIPEGTMIPAHGFYLFSEQDFPEGFGISPSGGTIYLQNAKYELIDQMGWPGGLDSGISLNRIPDGFATEFQGYDYPTSIDFREGEATPDKSNTGLPIVSISIERDRSLLCPGAIKQYFCRGFNTVGRSARIIADWSITDIGMVNSESMIVGVRCGNGVLTARYDALSDTMQIRGAVGGMVTNDVVWKKENSPYLVEGNTYIWFNEDEQRSNLHIEPGVEIWFMDDYTLGVSGTLTAEGTESMPIRFVYEIPPTQSAYRGLWLQNKTNKLSHCLFEGAGIAISLGMGYAIVSDCTFKHNRQAIVCNGDSYATISNCLFQSNDDGIIIFSGTVISYCIFRDNQTNLKILGGSSASNNLFVSTSYQQLGSGIEITSAKGEINIINNTIAGWENGITVLDSHSAKIRNNIISNCAIGIDGSADIAYNCISATTPFLNAPEGAGVISTTNARGDACDRYRNIFLNPGFMNADQGDYHLAANSACIDAGDPTILDTDRTVSDLGMYGGGIDTLSGVQDVSTDARPRVLRIERNYPNPFNPSTTIVFTLPEEGPVRLTVYNITGGKVRELVSGRLPAGRREARWDGKDDRGNTLSSGVYLARLTQGHAATTANLLMIK